MSTDRETTQIVRSWLEDGVTSLPDRVLDDVLDRLPTTPQRRARRPAWRMNAMTTPLRITVVAAAIGVLAIIGVIVPSTPGPGGGPDLLASPSPAPTAAPFPGPGALAPGTYEEALGTGTWSVTVPEGWEWFYSVLWRDLDGKADYTNVGGPGEVAFGWWQVENVFGDPCHWKDSLASPAVGPTVDDLVNALADQSGRAVTGPTDATVGGLPARRIDVVLDPGLDVSTCDEGAYRVFLSPGEGFAIDQPKLSTGLGPVAGRRDAMYVLDLAGDRYLLWAWQDPSATQADVADLEAMLGSIRIDLPTPSLSPSPLPSAAG